MTSSMTRNMVVSVLSKNFCVKGCQISTLSFSIFLIIKNKQALAGHFLIYLFNNSIPYILIILKTEFKTPLNTLWKNKKKKKNTSKGVQMRHFQFSLLQEALISSSSEATSIVKS